MKPDIIPIHTINTAPKEAEHIYSLTARLESWRFEFRQQIEVVERERAFLRSLGWTAWCPPAFPYTGIVTPDSLEEARVVEEWLLQTQTLNRWGGTVVSWAMIYEYTRLRRGDITNGDVLTVAAGLIIRAVLYNDTRPIGSLGVWFMPLDIYESSMLTVGRRPL